MRQGTKRGALLQLLEDVLGRLAISHDDQTEGPGILSGCEPRGAQEEDDETHHTIQRIQQ